MGFLTIRDRQTFYVRLGLGKAGACKLPVCFDGFNLLARTHQLGDFRASQLRDVQPGVAEQEVHLSFHSTQTIPMRG